MLPPAVPAAARRTARDRILEVAVDLVRTHGFASTSVDELCVAAGVTKGAFFHHFASKEALGVALADHWSATTGALFAAAPYHEPTDPLDRVLAYVDFRAALIEGEPAEFSCVAGTMVQEAFVDHPAIREACRNSIFGHAQTLEDDFAAAIEAHPPVAPVEAADLALHTQAALQGAFIVAKAGGDPALARRSIAHLRRYLELLFAA